MMSTQKGKGDGGRISDMRQGGTTVPGPPRSYSFGSESCDGREDLKTTGPQAKEQKNPHGGNLNIQNRDGSNDDKRVNPVHERIRKRIERVSTNPFSGDSSGPDLSESKVLVQGNRVYSSITISKAGNSSAGSAGTEGKILTEDERKAIRKQRRRELKELEDRGESPFAKGRGLLRSPPKDGKKPAKELGENEIGKWEDYACSYEKAHSLRHETSPSKEPEGMHTEGELGGRLNTKAQVYETDMTPSDREPLVEGCGATRTATRKQEEVVKEILDSPTRLEDVDRMDENILGEAVASSTFIEGSQPESANTKGERYERYKHRGRGRGSIITYMKRRDRQPSPISTDDTEATRATKRARNRSNRSANSSAKAKAARQRIRELERENRRLQSQLETFMEEAKKGMFGLSRVDVDILRKTREDALQLDSIRGKCKTGLQGAISGKMADHAAGIISSMDVLIGRYGSEARSPKGVNKVLEGLTEENDRLKREAIKSKRESKTMRWQVERRAKAPDNNARNAPKAGLALREGTEDPNPVRENKLTIIENVMLRPPVAQQIKSSKRPDMGISEEQFKTLVRELKEAMGINTLPTRTVGGPSYAKIVGNTATGKERRWIKQQPQNQGNAPEQVDRTHRPELYNVETGSEGSGHRPMSANNRSNDGEEGTGAETDHKWQVVRRKRRKRGENGEYKRNTANPGAPTVTQGARKQLRTAAITIKCPEGSPNYSEMMRLLRAKIKPKEQFGINRIFTRSARSGGMVVEVPLTDDGRKKASLLAEEMRKHVPADVRIDCPIRKTEVRITGIDGTITPAEITSKIAELTGQPSADIRIGRVAKQGRSSSAVIAMHPDSAIRLSNMRRIDLGWSTATIKTMEERPIQCFRCLQFGHIKRECTADEDMSDRCYRCGEKGHIAARCEAAPACVICGPEVQPHRMGGKDCLKAQRIVMRTANKERKTPGGNRHRDNG